MAMLLLTGSAAACTHTEDRQAAASAKPSVSVQGSAASRISVSVVSPTAAKTPKYIFFMIGDGMGKGQRNLAEKYMELSSGNANEKLFMNTLPVTGEVETKSLNSAVTDSAASGTAYATGQKTNNGMLSMTPDGNILETVMERAEKEGIATGVITTTSLTDATPAAFSVHCNSRASEIEIASDFVSCGVDFIAGGGIQHFLPASYTGGKDTTRADIISDRTDSRNLFSEFESKGYTTFMGAEGYNKFKQYEPTKEGKVFASFDDISLPYELDRKTQSLDSPTLAEMTKKGIDLLEKDEDGFVFMIEGGRIDHACHYNDAISAADETLAFDDSIKVAYDFYKEHPDNTLIVVLADHETGGLSLSKKTDLSVLNKVKVSTQGTLKFVYAGSNKDKNAFYKYISDNLGLGNISPDEKTRMEKAFALADSDKSSEDYRNYDPPAIAATEIVAERAGIKWTGFEHTSTNVPLNAVGWKSGLFSGTKDNADIGKLLFELIES